MLLMVNAIAAREWTVAALGEGEALGRHFVAATANLKAAADFGLPVDFEAERVRFPAGVVER